MGRYLNRQVYRWRHFTHNQSIQGSSVDNTSLSSCSIRRYIFEGVEEVFSGPPLDTGYLHERNNRDKRNSHRDAIDHI